MSSGSLEFFWEKMEEGSDSDIVFLEFGVVIVASNCNLILLEAMEFSVDYSTTILQHDEEKKNKAWNDRFHSFLPCPVIKQA